MVFKGLAVGPTPMALTSREQAVRMFGEGGPFTSPDFWERIDAIPGVFAVPAVGESNEQQLARLRKLLGVDAPANIEPVPKGWVGS